MAREASTAARLCRETNAEVQMKALEESFLLSVAFDELNINRPAFSVFFFVALTLVDTPFADHFKKLMTFHPSVFAKVAQTCSRTFTYFIFSCNIIPDYLSGVLSLLRDDSIKTRGSTRRRSMLRSLIARRSSDPCMTLYPFCRSGAAI